MDETAIVIGAIATFLVGFYTGLYIARHSYVDREVPKIIERDRVVEVEKPVVIQIPRQAAPQPAGLAVMGTSGQKGHVLDPKQQAEADRMSDLLNQMPEA